MPSVPSDVFVTVSLTQTFRKLQENVIFMQHANFSAIMADFYLRYLT
jgi:hypothetical protein